MNRSRSFGIVHGLTAALAGVGALAIANAAYRLPGNGVLPVASAASRSPQPKAPVQADHPAVRPSMGTEGEVWSDAEIIGALEECVRLLAPTGANVEVSKPIRNGQCGTPAPVLVKRVAGVELNPAPVVNCRVAVKVDQWIRETIQPAAQQTFGTEVRRLVTASSYMCRQRIGSSNERPSEHSFANALDISAFVTDDGRSIDVLTGWGQTVRDQQAQAKLGALAGGDARPLSDVNQPDRTATKEGQFLRNIHKGACGIFGTVLGPEANEAHRNHFHLDLAERRRSAFCE
jgi:hypothetical protein